MNGYRAHINEVGTCSSSDPVTSAQLFIAGTPARCTPVTVSTQNHLKGKSHMCTLNLIYDMSRVTSKPPNIIGLPLVGRSPSEATELTLWLYTSVQFTSP